jgi:hypothetical protein
MFSAALVALFRCVLGFLFVCLFRFCASAAGLAGLVTRLRRRSSGEDMRSEVKELERDIVNVSVFVAVCV